MVLRYRQREISLTRFMDGERRGSRVGEPGTARLRHTVTCLRSRALRPTERPALKAGSVDVGGQLSATTRPRREQRGVV
jgi:hypothetical protein